MKILIAAALPDLGEPSDRARDALLAKLAANDSVAQVVLARSLDWENLRAMEGGWEGAYGWAAKSHDAIAIVPTGEGESRGFPVSRGVFEMARSAMGLGHRVIVATRDGELLRVDRMIAARKGEGDWKKCFGWAVTIETRAIKALACPF